MKKKAGVNEMIRRCEGLIGTRNVNEWENTFLQSIARRTRGGKDCDTLSDKQIDAIGRIHDKNFCDGDPNDNPDDYQDDKDFGGAI